MKDDSNACRAEEGGEQKFVDVSVLPWRMPSSLSSALSSNSSKIDVKEDCGTEDFPVKQPTKVGFLQVNTKPLAQLLFAISSLTFILAEINDNILYSLLISGR